MCAIWLSVSFSFAFISVFSVHTYSVVSVEGRCPADTFSCNDGAHCISKNWVCNGDRDCPDGDDEHYCENSRLCEDGQFQCPFGKTHCISFGWQCDGQNDCDDGADEAPDICKRVDQYQCLPNMYRCPGTFDCINITKLCDRKADCTIDWADEGGHCLNRACGMAHCQSHQCKETMQGALCYCDVGQVYNYTVNQCVDINECLYDSYCDQDCVNMVYGYECSCQSNYTHNGDKSRCYVDPALTEPWLIISNRTMIQRLHWRDGAQLPMPYKINSNIAITAIGFHYSNQSICWVAGKRFLTCADAHDSSIRWNISMEYSLNSVGLMEKDWVSGNWYFADDAKEYIFMCTENGLYCTSIVHTGISLPKDLALDPTRGYMFYTDWSMSSKIGRADLDGQNQVILVSKKVVHPHGITLDFVKQHLYWGDSYLDFIERVDYNGDHRTTIAYGLNMLNVLSMSLLENDLYVINHHNHSIVRLVRYDAHREATLVQTPVENPIVIKAYHQVKQPNLPVDICLLKRCSHFCVPIAGNGSAIARCLCRSGYALLNETVCKPYNTSSYLLYANAQQGSVRSVSMDTSIKGDVMVPIVNLQHPLALAVDPRSNVIYYCDAHSMQIGLRHPDRENNTVLYPGGIGSRMCDGLAIDWIGNNLYWTDTDFRCIFVASLRNLSLVYKAIYGNLEHPKAITLVPSQGKMFWADWVMRPSGHKAKIETSLMDGSERHVIMDQGVQWPNSLCVDADAEELYWTEAYFDAIYRMKFDGSMKQRLVPFKNLDHPYGLVLHNAELYWTETMKGQIVQWNFTTNSTVVLRNDSKYLFDMVLVTTPVDVSDEKNQCSQKACSDLCLLKGPDLAVCICAIGRTFHPNGSCSGRAESLHCTENHFPCENYSICIPDMHTCDGVPHCPDGSDETPKACSRYNCSDGMHRCEGTRNCILAQFVCDGENDCHNGSDENEQSCLNHVCSKNHSKCQNSSHCIPDIWKCDGEDDCHDGSDEGSHCSYQSCSYIQFQCMQNGRCLPFSYRCDHEYDCEDKSDELLCDPRCSEDEFKCKDGSTCLAKIFVCDGESNCDDGSDEYGCHHTLGSMVLCKKDEFRCSSNTSCIPLRAVCDGIFDCVDKTDEHSCPIAGGVISSTQCHWSEFMCEDHSSCIPSVWRCDEDFDCGDHSDEIHCWTDCRPPNFHCTNSTICLPPEKLCNGIRDCPGPRPSDEGRLCSYDLCLNHDCSDKCHAGPEGYVCSCFDNRLLFKDNKTCYDRHMCAEWGACSQNCTVTSNASTAKRMCSCFDGYELDRRDDWSCKALNEESVKVIYSRRHEIRQLDLRDMSTVSLVSGLSNAIALDFFWDKKLLIWTDVGLDKIFTGYIVSNTVMEMHSVVGVGLATTEGVAVDWVGGNMYWVESNLDQIEVAKIDGSMRTTLLAGNMHNPRAIALDPRKGLLFWTDWDENNPRIERCSMSGDEDLRLIIYSIVTIPNGGWPNGLSVDFEAYRLYWVDARSDSVHSIRYDGSDHRLVLISHDYLSHAFSLTIFEQYIYWTDWRHNTVVKANKFNGSHVTVIQRTYTQPFDVKIYHPYRQPKVSFNPCSLSYNGGCSHLCLLGYDKDDKLVARCRCPHRWRLTSNMKVCSEDNTFLIYIRTNEIRGVDLNTPHYNVIPSITVPYVDSASAVDYDILSDRLFWTDRNRQTITSAFLNGTGIQTIIDIGLCKPEAVCIDWMSSNMYFTSCNGANASISVARLDGAFRKEVVTESVVSKINSLAIHPEAGLMFWSKIGGVEHQIMWAYMDGTNKSVFVRNATNARSLTIDLKGGRLYWVSQVNPSKVFYCHLAVHSMCNKRKQSLDRVISPISLTIYAHVMYYSSSDKIVKKDLDDNFSGKEFLINTTDVSALQVYDPSHRTGSNGCSGSNGGCQQLCLPHNLGHSCLCTAGFELGADGRTCNSVAFFILYSTNTEIGGLSLPDYSQSALPPVSQIFLASSIDFYEVDNYIYWVDSTTRKISRIKRDLSNRKAIIHTGVGSVESIAVDWIAGNIYWVDRVHGVIRVAKLDGSRHFVVIHDNVGKPCSIVVHPAKGFLFIADCSANPRIIRARLDGSDMVDFVSPVDTQLSNNHMNDLHLRLSRGIDAPYGLAVDYSEDYLYWCDRNLDIIERVSIVSGLRTVISTDLTDCVAIDVFEGFVYWADATQYGGCIKRANKFDGSGVEIIKKNISQLHGLKIFHARKDGSLANKCAVNNGGCEELCLYHALAKDNGISCACAHGKLANDRKSCDIYKSFLLFSKVTSIESILLSANTTNLNAPLESIRPNQGEIMKNVIGLTFDYKYRRLYFSDVQRGDIHSVHLNNTHYIRVNANVGSAEGLAFDSNNQLLFFTSFTNSSINRLDFKAELPSLQPEHVMVQKVLVQLRAGDHPRAIVVNPCIQQIFWSNWNDKQPAIQTATYDGYDSKSIITERIRTPNGLAIDYKARKLYWSDARLDKIERMNYDGSERMVVVTDITQHSFSLAVHGDYLYWTDWLLRAVLRANKYDGTGVTWLRKHIERQPMGIVVVDEVSAECEADPCYGNAFGCDHLCSVTVKGDGQCSCHDNFKLLPDGKRCISITFEAECSADDFVCMDKSQCISFNLTCDGVVNCTDASDESDAFCSTIVCPANYLPCDRSAHGHSTRFCLQPSRICDGDADCINDLDEENCPCKSSQFHCQSNGLCIDRKMQCDGVRDCVDYSDEIGCNVNCSVVNTDSAKLNGLISCNTTSMCIYPSWICDGNNDCWDNNDEIDCDYTNKNICQDGDFRCMDGACIRRQWQCDLDEDCADGSDEENCSVDCNTEQFQCDQNPIRCIPLTWQCDGHEDCKDGSDENPDHCRETECDLTTHFRCDEGQCITKEWLCDEDFDCVDGSDEGVDVGCELVMCAWDQFKCLNHRCVQSVFHCDGDNDCGDGSDEPDSCEHGFCWTVEFQCAQGYKCIPKFNQCDGFTDCPDHSDEANCDLISPCGDMFQCRGGSCIEQELVCNGYADCMGNEDEPSSCGVNECLAYNGYCSHQCIDHKVGYKCACPKGLQLGESNSICIDIDECSQGYPCSQFCENHIGSFQCSCAQNYTLEKDDTSCKSDRMDITSGHTSQLDINAIGIVAMDFDWRDQYVYWSEVTSSSSLIKRKCLDPNIALKIEVVHSTAVKNAVGLAVDWEGRNLYWCDKDKGTIEVSRLNGSNRMVLLKERVQEPHAVKVFPQKGLLFFINLSDFPYIGSIHMDGSQRKIIVQDHLVSPVALTVDYITSTVFFVDKTLHYIGVCCIDGTKRHMISRDGSFTPTVFAMTTFESQVYWTDWENGEIMTADKFSGNNSRSLISLAQRPMDIQVFHPLRQAPDDETVSVMASCSCPINFYLSHDRVSCISNCTMSQFKCHDDSKCIPRFWECDGRPDCIDKSDEHANCGTYHCIQPGMFQCSGSDSRLCLLPNQVCDGIQQCDDGDDEFHCDSYTCLDQYFKCSKDNKCIMDIRKCDGRIDCSDREDEMGCANVTCSPDKFQCDNSRCISYVWRCDGDQDCGDQSDETLDCTSQHCLEGHFQCNKTGRCIPDDWKCDGDQDCGRGDDSDELEEECTAKTCDSTFFRCDNGHCIPVRWRCDFHNDCKDSSDENGCQIQNCTQQQYTCANRRCIEHRFVCDGADNCGDHSDEAYCTKNCSAEEFLCNRSKHCIPNSWKCDGDVDCFDNSDELGCYNTCHPGEFQCDNSICQPLLWRCDGGNDCGDNSDENPALCAKYACAPGRFRCNDHICIWNRLVCNRHGDCSDGEDELPSLCLDRPNCFLPDFSCNQSNLCLPASKVCDDHFDCSQANSSDKSDEDPIFCKNRWGQSCDDHTKNRCEHFCRVGHLGVHCLCDSGFQLSENGFSCDEVNECDLLGTCSQHCLFDSKQRMHVCSCDPGFRQLDNRCYLESKGDNEPLLVLAVEDHVEAINLMMVGPLSMMNSTVKTLSNVQGHHIISLDIDMDSKTLFILSHVGETWKIMKQGLFDPAAKKLKRDTSTVGPVTIVEMKRKLVDLSVDWISNRIYVCDETMHIVFAINYQGKRSKTIIDCGRGSPQAVSIDALHSKLYWTEMGVRPSIQKANLDGSDPEVLIARNLVLPSDLAVDIANQRLYWLDSKLGALESCTTAGKNRKMLKQFYGALGTLTLFGDMLYIALSDSVFHMKKFTSELHGIVYKTSVAVKSVLIWHGHRQPSALNACEDQHDTAPGCISDTQMCFNLPRGNISCVCPDSSQLEHRRCQFTQCHCLNGGTCLKTSTAFKCRCPLGYNGDNCEHYVCTDYCFNGGYCVINAHSQLPDCVCPPHFSSDGRCRNVSTVDCDKSDFCHNGGICQVEHSGFRSCVCPKGFQGVRCENCYDRVCKNGGVCTLDGWHRYCLCASGYDPESNCAETCVDTCTHRLDLQRQFVSYRKGSCNCDCPPTFVDSDCDHRCVDYCQNDGVCSIDDDGNTQCECPHQFYGGERCEVCRCWPGGQCLPNESRVVVQCSCYKNSTGEMCESQVNSNSDKQSEMSHSNAAALWASIAIVVFVVAMVMTALVFRRVKRRQQFRHKRMLDGHDVNMTNPLYRRRDMMDGDDDEDDEQDSLRSQSIYIGGNSVGVGRNMYDMCNPSASESMQTLLESEDTGEDVWLVGNCHELHLVADKHENDAQYPEY